MSGVSKFTADRHQRILLDLVSKPGNDVCADCKARSPRWASHNLGIFLCMNCASIHRKIGTHVTKVKSVTMDAWSREQVEAMKNIGNIASNAKYNPDEVRNPPPANREESERDSELEKFIRRKYEFKRFMVKPSAKPPPSSMKPQPTRAQTTPATRITRQPSPVAPAPPASTANTANPIAPSNPLSRPFSASAIVPSSSRPQPPVVHPVAPGASAATQPLASRAPSNPVWDDIMSLAGPPVLSTPQSQQPAFVSPLASGNPYATLSSASPFPLASVDRSQYQNVGQPVAASTPLSFQQPFQSQSQMGNPFITSQQAPGFTGQMTGTMFQQAPMQGQPPFGQPSQSSFPPAAQQASFAQSYTPSPAFQQQQPRQQQFTQSTFPQMQMQPYQPQSQSQMTQGGNPFGAWPQQTGFTGQAGFPVQPQPGFQGQPVEFTGQQQQYGQYWPNT